MSILLILLISLLILLILNLFVSRIFPEVLVYEGFQTSSAISPDTIQGYLNFLSFYNPFCVNWQKAIISSIALDTPQEPLTSPSQVGNSNAPVSTTSDMNTYIAKLSQQIGQQLPQVCITFPDTLNSTNIAQIISQMPTDISPYINALNWMNQQLENAHSNLGNALGGIEGFDGSQPVCQDITQCLTNDPQLIQKIAEELSQQINQQITQQEQNLMSLMMPFVSTPALSDSFKKNTILVEKSQEIQNQAQSGELLNKINVPGGNSTISYSLPPGANNLSQIQSNNPQRYRELKTNYSGWVAIKGLMDQINGTL